LHHISVTGLTLLCDIETTEMLFKYFSNPIMSNFKGLVNCLQCSDAVGWAAERHPACKKTEWWGASMVICLEPWSEVQTCTQPSLCHCHSLSLASVKSRLVLPFWYRLTWVVLDKGL